MNRLAAVCAVVALCSVASGCAGTEASQSPATTTPESPVVYTQATIDLPTGAGGDPFLADFNGDQKLDIGILTSSTTISVFLNNGDGTFESPVATTISEANTAITGTVVGDFNEDGKADLVLSLSGPGAVPNTVLLLGNGDGTFHAGPTMPNSQGFSLGRAIDLNGDHHLDLVQAINGGGFTPNGGLMISLGNGDGTFAPSRFLPVSGVFAFTGMAAADFNGDGNLDLLLSSYNVESPIVTSNPILFFFAGNGSGIFQAPIIFTSSIQAGQFIIADFSNMTSVISADLSAQGQQDVIAAGRSFGSGNPPEPSTEDRLFSGFNGSGDTDLYGTGAVLPASETGDILQIADLNGDGRPDLIALNSPLGLLTITLNGEIGQASTKSGIYQFKVAVGYSDSYTNVYAGNIVVGDLNGDGLSDIVVSPDGSGSISILLSQKP